jgi:hypothetical protein
MLFCKAVVGAKELTHHKIEENIRTPPALLCNMYDGKGYELGRCFRDDTVAHVNL